MTFLRFVKNKHPLILIKLSHLNQTSLTPEERREEQRWWMSPVWLSVVDCVSQWVQLITGTAGGGGLVIKALIRLALGHMLLRSEIR